MHNDSHMQENPPEQPQAAATPTRSGFITAVAWVFICLAAAFAVIDAGELALMLVLPAKTVHHFLNSNGAVSHMSPYGRFFIEHIGATLTASLIALIMVFVTAIGLLKRERWARPTMAVLLVLAIIRYVIAVTMQLIYFSPASLPAPAHSSPGEAATYHSFMTVTMYGSAIFSLFIAAVFTWIVVRLLSPAIKAEFGEPAPAAAAAPTANP